MAARVIVIGAGPAGVRAAQALVEAGLRPVVIDEGRRDGGQIYRRQPEGFSRSYRDAVWHARPSAPRRCTRDFDALKEQDRLSAGDAGLEHLAEHACIW